MTKPDNSRQKTKATPKLNRCAIYARCATDLKRSAPSSIAEQVRVCTEHAGKEGWKIIKVQADVAVSGASLAGRHALNSLLASANLRPRPFDRVLIADPARLARNSADYVRILEHFGVNGVDVVTISEGLVLKGIRA
jgi:site-specific DNA recombinase